MRAGPSGGLKLRAAVAMVGVALFGASLASAPVAAAPQYPADCPRFVPVSEVTKGMTGYGLTVSSGDQPERFAVEVLGVLENGIGPGRDMIIVDTSSPAIEKAHGIWFGMSGSPIYIGDRLLGAVAYGLGFGPSSIAGVTPAQDMLDLLNYQSASAETTMAGRAELTPSLKRSVARSEGTTASEVDSDMVQLKLPLSVSGVGQHRSVGKSAFEHIKEAVDRENLPFVVYAGSAAGGATDPAPAPPEPGGNFAAALSYGDVTFAGIGTTTVVCDGRALSFGHPFNFDGATSLGANAADAITIVDDSVFGSFKLANVRGMYGTLDQDRLAGVRTELGAGPVLTPITSDVISTGTLRTRHGESDSVDNEFVPFLTFIHMFTNIDATIDRIGEGSSALDWTITGTTESGQSWELNRSNLYASDYDISFGSLFELLNQLYTLLYNDFEDITFTGVDVDSTFDDEVKQYTIIGLETSVNGGAFRKVRRVNVHRGDALTFRVTLEPYDGTADKVVDISMNVPRHARRDGYVQISGGEFDYYYDYYCFEEGSGCADSSGNKIESFSDLVTSLENQPKGNEVRARLDMGRKRKLSTAALDQVVTGFRYVRLNLRGGSVSVSGSGSSKG